MDKMMDYKVAHIIAHSLLHISPTAYFFVTIAILNNEKGAQVKSFMQL